MASSMAHNGRLLMFAC